MSSIERLRWSAMWLRGKGTAVKIWKREEKEGEVGMGGREREGEREGERWVKV